MSQDYEDDRDEGAGPPDEGLPPEDSAVRAAARRTSVPGIFLIICGLLNLFGVAVQVFGAVYVAQMTVDQYEVSLDQAKATNSPAAAIFEAQIEEQIRKKGKDPKDLPPDELKRERSEAMKEVVAQTKQQALWQLPLGGILNLAAVIFPILAGVRMRALRSFGICVTGAVIAAVPCVSCASCPCGLGAIFGIWALIVLLNPDVKDAFR